METIIAGYIGLGSGLGFSAQGLGFRFRVRG